MTCTTCQTSTPQHELRDGLCLSCLHAKAKLQAVEIELLAKRVQRLTEAAMRIKAWSYDDIPNSFSPDLRWWEAIDGIEEALK